jgi:hypothetical protein
MSNKTVIGLAGVKTSGKSTVTNIIKKLIPETVEVALADKLKNVSSEVFKLNREQFDKQSLKEVEFENPIILNYNHIVSVLNNFNVYTNEEQLKNIYGEIIGRELRSPRDIAQFIGTEILRATGDEDIHCNNLNLVDNQVNVISDLRFLNEFEYFSNIEGVEFIPMYVHRTLAESAVNENSHISEREVFMFSDKCLKIDNNGTLENTENQIKNILLNKILK